MTAPSVLRAGVTAVALVALALGQPCPVSGQEVCPRASGADAEAGWVAYRDGALALARQRFEAALARCPDDGYARTGLGYVALREGRDTEAAGLFEAVVAVRPDDVDALTGLGLLAWRDGDLQAVAARFTRVLELVPDHATALDYLARLPQGLGPPPERPPLVLPDTLEYPARTQGDRFEIRTPRGWEPFYIKGMNLGAALPGSHPSEFPDSATYARWIAGMADMNANVVRVYTIHPPHFYQALLDWNTRHPQRALRLIHGVWTELPEDHDFRGRAFEGAFFDEMRRVVDLLHGRADVAPRPGHASGHYVADVSDWTLAYIIGREWEPFSALAFDSIRGGASGFRGRYLRVDGGNAMDAWLGRAMEEIVAYETETYRNQRPVAYTNWPTLDPLTHPTETTVDEELAIRRARGEDPDLRPREYDNDALGLDANLVRPTADFPAGTFASFHAYPYYPDFMVVQEEYLEARSSLGPSNYFGYLQDLKAHHPDMPVVISEYGVPASLTNAHLQPQGRHHGGLTEARMAEVNRRMTLELAEAGMAGGALFAWIDEWFKKNWVTIDFEIPEERNRLWFNRLDAEQHYGMWAMDPRPAVPGSDLDGRMTAWLTQDPYYTEGEASLRVAQDAAYLWLLVEAAERPAGSVLHVGFDMIEPGAGDFRLPGQGSPRFPVGLEFALRDDGDAVRLLVDPPSNPFRFPETGAGGEGLEGRTFPVADAPPGLFRDRVEQRHNLPYYTEPNEDGRYDSLRLVVNRRRFSRDSTEYLAVGYDRGVLPPGAAPDGLWERSPDGRFLEVRIPWTLLNVTDPSSRQVLQGPGANTTGAELGADGRWRLRDGVAHWPDSLTGPLGTETVEDIGLVMALEGPDGAWRSWPPENAPPASVARFTWPTWEEPQWVERPRPVFDAMRETYAGLNPYGVAAVVAPEPEAGPVPLPQVTDSAALAWDAGDHARARALYEARLRDDPDDALALHRAALLAAWAEAYDHALDLLARLIQADPENLDARVDEARVMAWQGEVQDAIDRLEALLVDHPDHSGALEARARFEAWAGRYEASLSSYDQLLAIAPDNAAARRQQAQVLSWASRFDASRAVYDSILADDPDDVEARLGLARVLAFADDLAGAEAEYRRVIQDHPGEVPAHQGLAQALSWGGHLVDGEERYRHARTLDPADVATLVGLAQNLRWQGRTAAAYEVLSTARSLDPNNGDVREQLRWVQEALAPQARPSFVVEDDSDGNRMVTASVAARWYPSPRLQLRTDVYQRDLKQNALARTALGLTVTGSYQLEPGWTVAAGVGGSESDRDGSNSFAALHASVASPGRYPAQGTLRWATGALDATALLAERGVRLTELSLSGRWTPVPGWRVDGALGRARFKGAESNTRTNASVSASRRVGRSWTLGGGLRTFGFAEDLNDGYFDPDFYGIAEVTGRWLLEPDSWSFTVEVAPGVQQVTSDGDPAGTFRTSARVGYRVAPGREISVGAGYSSAGLQSFSTGASDYSYTALILGASWIF